MFYPGFSEFWLCFVFVVVVSFTKCILYTKDIVNFFLFFLQGIDVDAESCAVCIENFKGKDVIRILPCKYVLLLPEMLKITGKFQVSDQRVNMFFMI